MRRDHADVLDLGKTVRQARGDLRSHHRAARVVAVVNDRHHGEPRQRSLEQEVRLQHRRGNRKPHEDRTEPGQGGDHGLPIQTKYRAFLHRGDVGRWRDLAGRFRSRPLVVRRTCGGRSHHLRRQQIAAAGDELDELPPLVTERGAELTDALEQAVLTDMDVRPDRLHQLLLGQEAATAGREQAQHLEGLGAELDRGAIGATQLGPLLIQLKPGETKQAIPQRVSQGGSYSGSLAKMPENRA